MKAGILFHDKLEISNIIESGFTYVESELETIQKVEGLQVSGIQVRLDTMTPERFYDAMVKMQEMGAQYLVINTSGEVGREQWTELIEQSSMMLADFQGEIYLENGYKGNDERGYVANYFSDAGHLKDMCRYANRICESERFGVCLNIGYANILVKNIRSMILDLKQELRLLHVNDNDGNKNQRQLPYTFTMGRGSKTTNWNFILGNLMKIQYKGWIIFDTVGLFQRIPVELQVSMLKLEREIVQSWDKQFYYEDLLNQPDKKIILFGAGNMAHNYMNVWGKQYPPAFMVDNLKQRWGTLVEGIEVRKPEAILEIPEEERLVLICNVYYSAVKQQLNNMGVAYECYCDEFYM